MKQKLIAFLCIAALCLPLLSACRREPAAETETAQSEQQESAPVQPRDLYTPNDYDPENFFFQKHFWVDYGTVIKQLQYYSRTAGETKYCNVLLPANYSEDKAYPVLYVLHGFHGQPEDHIADDSYLVVLYGNLLYRGLAKEMIIVSVDLYTAKAANKQKKTQKQLRFIYDKVIDDIHLDVMPLIEKTYSVKAGRENTAVAGVSEGGAKALCIGFRWMKQFSYIGAFAPNPGVVPTPYYLNSFWDKTIFKRFPDPGEEYAFRYIYLAVGDQDHVNKGVTLTYRDKLNTLAIKNQTDCVEGYGHKMDFWKRCFYNFLGKVFY